MMVFFIRVLTKNCNLEPNTPYLPGTVDQQPEREDSSMSIAMDSVVDDNNSVRIILHNFYYDTDR